MAARIVGTKRRVVAAGTLMAELSDRGFLLRPKRSRRPDAAVFTTWEQAYMRALMAQAPPPKRRKRTRRGLIRP